MNNLKLTDEEIQQLHRARIERMRMEKQKQEEQRTYALGCKKDLQGLDLHCHCLPYGFDDGGECLCRR